MKKIYLLSAMVLAGLFANKAQAQISVHIGFNVPVRHVYVPAPQPEVIYNDDFDNSDDYYYLPDVEAYYSIPLQCYFYNDGNRWIRSQYLPGAYRNYDWRSARRFEVRGRRPYMNHDVYRGRWGGNANRGDWNHRNNDYANRGDYGRGNNNAWGRDNNRGDQGRNDNRGGWGQRDNNQGRGGYNQPDRNQGGGRGGWGGQNGQQQQQPQQPSNGGQHGGWGGQQGGGQQQPTQPTNNGGGQHGGWGGQQGGGNQNGGGQQGGGQHGGGQNGGNGGGQVAQNGGGHNARQGGFMRPARF